MHKYKIEKGYYYSFAPEKGHNKDRFNRAAKIAREFTTIEAKLKGMVERGGNSLHAQMALGLLLTMHTGIRIGNESSAEGYMTKPHPYSKKEPEFVQTYGLTTLLIEHLLFQRSKTFINFVGKKQVENSFTISGWFTTKLKELCNFKEYYGFENGRVFEFSAYDLTKFIKKYVGKQYSPKDFRTMRANYVASIAWRNTMHHIPENKKEAKAQIKQICVSVSEELHNTPGVCKKSYIDPRLLWAYEEEKLHQLTKNKK